MSILDYFREKNKKKLEKKEEDRKNTDAFIDALYSSKERNKKEKRNNDLGYNALNDSIDKLIEQKRKVQEEYRTLKENYKKQTLLEKKIDNYIKWYKEVFLADMHSQRNVEYLAKELENFIDKVAVWYELRYPDYEINRMLPSTGQQVTKIDNVMFDNNNYINENFDENSDVRLLEWDKLLNASAFINSLTSGERPYLAKPRYYRDIVYYEKGKSPHFHISSNGTVLEAEYMEVFNKVDEGINNKELEGKSIKEVIDLFKEKNIFIPYDSEMKEVVRVYDNRVRLKESLLDSIMYKILERGGNRIGPRRAFLFAKEFDRDVRIPMRYGVDTHSPGMRQFINEYIKAGGTKDLVCLKDYYYDKYLDENEYETITISELIKTQWDNCAEKYTKEEQKLFERLVNDINMTIDHEELEKEKVKQKRIERRLNKNR